MIAFRRSPTAFLHRYPAVLAGVFAFLALLLGTIGLYGLVAYSVSQRTQEIGIRMALGAQRNNVLQMILLQGVRLIAPGIAVGIAAAILVSLSDAQHAVRNPLLGPRDLCSGDCIAYGRNAGSQLHSGEIGDES